MDIVERTLTMEIKKNTKTKFILELDAEEYFVIACALSNLTRTDIEVDVVDAESYKGEDTIDKLECTSYYLYENMMKNEIPDNVENFMSNLYDEFVKRGEIQ